MRSCRRRWRHGCAILGTRHLADLGMIGATDRALANHAERTNSIMVTKDEDFVILQFDHRFTLLWLRCGNATNRALLTWLAPRWGEIERLLSAGEQFVEVR